tara:strand:+ start:3006 stop:3560 length:555 start_codon:yes stop_codon:yes gene_type:complete
MKIRNIIREISFHNLTKCNDNEISKILEIRNEKKVRANMFTKHIITKNEHNLWFDKLKVSKKEIFFGIKYKNEIIGGLGLKDIIKFDCAYWSFYLSENKSFIGLGASVEFKALDWFFTEFNFSKLYCFVLKKNVAVIKLHRKFGFIDERFKKTSKNEVKNIDFVHLELSIDRWKKVKENLKRFN